MRKQTYIASAIAIVALAGVLVMASHRKRHPGEHAEDEALAAFAKLRAGGDTAAAIKVLAECAIRDPQACRCSDLVSEFAVDTGQYARAWGPVMHVRCENTARHLGARAELLIAYHLDQQGLDEAQKALAMDAKEPHANFALAWGLGESDPPRAIAAAEQAVAGGRGVPAMLLLGTLQSKGGDLRAARDAVDDANRVAPTDPRVAYDLGVTEQAAGHFSAAREAYLRALRANPRLVDARYNLAVLTHSVHADDEARHDLDEMAAIAPDDPRLPALRAALSTGAKDGGPRDAAVAREPGDSGK